MKKDSRGHRGACRGPARRPSIPLQVIFVITACLFVLPALARDGLSGPESEHHELDSRKCPPEQLYAERSQHSASVVMTVLFGTGEWFYAVCQPDTNTYNTCVALLQDEWGITTKADLLREIDRIWFEGDRAAFNAISASAATPTGGLSNALPAPASDANNTDEWRLKTVREHGRELGDKGIIGWDCARVSALAFIAHRACMLGEEDALLMLWAASSRAQKVFSSWNEFAQSCLVGAEFSIGPGHDDLLKKYRDTAAFLSSPGYTSWGNKLPPWDEDESWRDLDLSGPRNVVSPRFALLARADARENWTNNTPEQTRRLNEASRISIAKGEAWEAMATFAAKLDDALRQGEGKNAELFEQMAGEQFMTLGWTELALEHYKRSLAMLRKRQSTVKSDTGAEYEQKEFILLRQLDNMSYLSGYTVASRRYHDEKMAQVLARMKKAGVDMTVSGTGRTNISEELLGDYALVKLSECYFLVFDGRPGEAISELNALIKILHDASGPNSSGKTADRHLSMPVQRALLYAHLQMGEALHRAGYYEDALASYEVALKLKPGGTLAQYGLLAEALALEERATLGDRSPAILSNITTVADTARSGLPRCPLQTKCKILMCKGTVFAAFGKLEGAKDTIAELFDVLAGAADAELSAEAVALRSEMNLEAGDTDGVEQDLIEELQFRRSRGFKFQEPELYLKYAQLLRLKGLNEDALDMYAESHRIFKVFGLHVRAIETLLDAASLCVKMNADDMLDWTWEEIDLDIAAAGRIPNRVTSLIQLARPQRLARPGSDSSNLPPCAPVVSNVLGKVPEGIAPEGSGVSGPAMAGSQSTSVELEPVRCVTHVLPEELARGRFVLSNTSVEPEEGILSFAGTLGIGKWNFVQGRHDIWFGDSESAEPRERKLRIMPKQEISICLTAKAGSNNMPVTVDLAWSGKSERRAMWKFMPDSESQISTVVNASLAHDSPFYSVPVFHDIYFRGNDRTIHDFRLTSSVPCRIEVYNEDTGALLCADVSGDGSLTQQGDILVADADSDGFGDIVLDGSNPIGSLRVYLFPKSTLLMPMSVTVQIRTSPKGEWQIHAIDDIVPYNANAKP